MIVDDIARFLDQFAPADLAESWDNVGLLAGDRVAPVTKVMTCLTITPASAAEADAAGAELIVTHHPLPFRPLEAPDNGQRRKAGCCATCSRPGLPFTVPTLRLIQRTAASTNAARRGPGTRSTSSRSCEPCRRPRAIGGRAGQPQVVSLARGAGRLGCPLPAGTTGDARGRRGSGNSCGLGKSKRSAILAGLWKRWPWRAVVPANSWRLPMRRAAGYLSPAKSASILA